METPKGLTKEQLFYWKLKNDFAWYAERFLKIRNKAGEIVPFKLNAPQTKFWQQVQKDKDEGKPRRYIILKARQMGFSTMTEGLLFHETTTTPNTNTLILAHESQASANLFNMSKMYYELLPPLIRPKIKRNNSRTLTFENPDDSTRDDDPGLRSKYVVATAGTGEVGRSFTGSLIHISEMAFFQDAKKTLTGLLQTMPSLPNTMVVIESTANGVGDFFHQEWQRAVKGESDYTPLFFGWFEMPDYTLPFNTDYDKQKFIEEVEFISYDRDGNAIRTDESLLREKFDLSYEQLHWRRWTIRNKCHGDIEMFYQEYPSTPDEAFVASGRPKFSIPSLRKYTTITKEGERGYLDEKDGKVVFRSDPKGYVEIWDRPKSNIHYSIGADVAEGLVNGDYSCAVVGDDEFNVVALWHGHIDPDLFGAEIVKLAKFYNQGYVGVESNNHGLTTLRAIQRLEYHNLYYQKTYDKIADDITKKVGWGTNARTKPLMIDKLAEYIRERWIGIYSELIISEAFTYVIEDNGSTNAQNGCHDDTIMALAIMIQMLLENRGMDYAPEVPKDDDYLGRRRPKEIIDPMFEGEEDDEYAE